jgi:hypothetical protein
MISYTSTKYFWYNYLSTRATMKNLYGSIHVCIYGTLIGLLMKLSNSLDISV